MTEPQRLWWRQVQSDHEILRLLRRSNAPPSHQLHYLQMVAEKLAKAYFWRTGRPPAKSHAMFVRFLRALDARPRSDAERIASLFGLGRRSDLAVWVRAVTPIAYAVERLAPDLAGDDGPNPEYPWP